MRKYPMLCGMAMLTAALLLLPSFVHADQPAQLEPAKQGLRVLFITGADSHDWQGNTRIMKQHLPAFGIGAIDMKIVPRHEDWLTWEGDYADYDVIAIMYYQPTAPPQSVEALAAYVKQGGGLALVHSGLGGFRGQAAMDRMTGMAWRGANDGKSLMLDEDGNKIIRQPGEGRGAVSSAIEPFYVDTHDPTHPIMRGLPMRWKQSVDEYYYHLRGPLENLHVLATTVTPHGEHAPIMWTNTHGQGRIFVTVIGHGNEGVDSVGFITTFARGLQWAATGEVSYPVPSNFPTAESSSRGMPVFED